MLEVKYSNADLGQLEYLRFEAERRTGMNEDTHSDRESTSTRETIHMLKRSRLNSRSEPAAGLLAEFWHRTMNTKQPVAL